MMRQTILLVSILFLVFVSLNEVAFAYILGEYYAGYGTSSPPNPFSLSYYKCKRLDSQINFSWSSDGPGLPGIGGDNFAVGWRGWINIPTSGVWTFYTITDDGVRLRVAGNTLIDKWQDQAIEWQGSINLSAGWQKIEMDYFENTGGATALLFYSGPGVVKQPIPPEAFDINTRCYAMEWH